MKKDLSLFLLCIFLISAALTGCRHSSSASRDMDAAERLMPSSPDSALLILRSLDKTALRGDKEKARYSLLMSMALDKNFIDTTSFDVLQPALDYYPRHGSPDARLRTLYYQGRIFMNRGDDKSAIGILMKALDNADGISDSLTLAHTLVALGVLDFKQYRHERFIDCNLKAARIYGRIGRRLYEARGYAKALNGYVITDNRNAADSIAAICDSLASHYPETLPELQWSYRSYRFEYGSPGEIADILRQMEASPHSDYDDMTIARGYYNIGDYDAALRHLSGFPAGCSVLDSLKFLSIKSMALEKSGDFKQAVDAYRMFTYTLDVYHSDRLTSDLLFARERYQIEAANREKVSNREKIILFAVLSILILVLASGWRHYRYLLIKAKREKADMENRILRIDKQRLTAEKSSLEKEKLHVEKDLDRKTTEAKSLMADKEQLESQNKIHLEMNEELRQEKLLLQQEMQSLQQEVDMLRQLTAQKELSQSARDVIMSRLDMLNGLLAKEISNNDSYARSYSDLIHTIHDEREKFITSNVIAFSASHPDFISYLKSHGLTDVEISYACLYALGLQGKEIGNYIRLKRHYNISSAIRRKLGLSGHDTNISIYIRQLLDSLK